MKSGKQNILNLIREQHKMLKKSIEILKDEKCDQETKVEHLARFMSLLKMHSEAEEQTIYEVLGELKSSEMLIFEAQEEHALAKKLMQELESVDYGALWNAQIEAKAKVLAEIVEHHAEEEEQEVFEEARKSFTTMELETLGEEFQAICERFDPLLMHQRIPNDFSEMSFR